MFVVELPYCYPFEDARPSLMWFVVQKKQILMICFFWPGASPSLFGSVLRPALVLGHPGRRYPFEDVASRTSPISAYTKRQLFSSCLFLLPGDVLLFQDPAVQVPSALEGLTVVFGMGTRVSPPPLLPDILFY